MFAQSDQIPNGRPNPRTEGSGGAGLSESATFSNPRGVAPGLGSQILSPYA